ncbi:hypothetical protein [Cobetia marina]|uniref:hypothetical protein n=1 Tax=Cobetia marina TaxID=28258 RepID=UPI0011437DBC|nr:hypothetical protein [Cobetia marina]GED41552.1 hypothetical protein HHA02_08810 [Cobetia marina]
MHDDIVNPTVINEAQKGDFRALGNAMCILCDDIGMGLEQVVEEFWYVGLDGKLAQEALAHGRFSRQVKSSYTSDLY